VGRPAAPRARVAALSACALLAACAVVSAPRIVLAPARPLPEAPRIYLAPGMQRGAVLRSLGRAGFSVTRDPSASRYTLDVDVGSPLRLEDCGSFANVRYVLYSRGRKLVEIAARGWTGTCEESIFDAMSRLLATQFAGAVPAGRDGTDGRPV
jgi:hypothetical protein